MDEIRNVYQKYLFRLSVLLLCLFGVQLLGTLILWHWIERVRPMVSVPTLIVEGVLAMLVGGLSLLSIKYKKQSGLLLALTAADFIGLTIVLTSFSLSRVDQLIDISVFLVGLTLYLQVLSETQEHGWQRTQKAKPLALDLRIAGSGDLFDPLVIAPHLEINESIVSALDHFLATAERSAPLQLYIHGGERISPLLQETMVEVLQDHYRDEEIQVNRFLERRFGRALCLILVSVAALQILHRFSQQDSSAIVWTIVSNFAGFSLWQIGATYFERAEAKRQLLRIRIAKNAEIHFL